MMGIGFPAQRSALACRIDAAFAPLPLNRNLTKNCGIPSVCLDGRESCNTCSTRHSGEKAETYFLTAGAGERGKRFAHSLPSCRKKKKSSLLEKGISKGKPLRCPFGDFSGKRKVTRRRQDTPKGRFVLSAASRHGIIWVDDKKEIDKLQFIDLFAYIRAYIPDSRASDRRSKTQTIVPWEHQDEQEKQRCLASAFRFPLFEADSFRFLCASQKL